jgi:hypothetical protein
VYIMAHHYRDGNIPQDYWHPALSLEPVRDSQTNRSKAVLMTNGPSQGRTNTLKRHLRSHNKILYIFNFLKFSLFGILPVESVHIKKKKLYVYWHLLKKNSVGRSDLLFFIIIFFLFWKLVSFVFLELLFVIFLYLLTVLNTLSIVIDDIIPFDTRIRQNFPHIKNFPTKGFSFGVKKWGRSVDCKHIYIFFGLMTSQPSWYI